MKKLNIKWPDWNRGVVAVVVFWLIVILIGLGLFINAEITGMIILSIISLVAMAGFIYLLSCIVYGIFTGEFK